MPEVIRKQLKRYEIPGHARYLTFSCFKRQPLLDHAGARNTFADQLHLARVRLGFQICAWVVMPEHVHLLIWPRLPEAPTPKILRTLKQGFAQTVIRRWHNFDARILNRVADPAGHPRFWQRGGGHDRNIHSEDELREKINYIHNNPVARELVERPIDWVWSSARWYEGMRDQSLRIDPIERPV